MLRYSLPPLILALGALTARAAPATAVLVDGKPLTATLVSVDATWNLTFETPTGKRTIPAVDLVQWGVFPTPTKGSQLLLVDGGVISADLETIDKESLSADSETFGKLKLPLELLTGVIVRLPLQNEARDQLQQQILGADGVAAKTDRLLLENSDELTGTLAGLNSGTYEFESTAGVVKLPESKVLAVVFNPSLAARPPKVESLHAWVGFRDGSRVMAEKLTLNSQPTADIAPRGNRPPEQVVVTTSGGVNLTANAADVTALLPLGGKTRYLSDMKPDAYRHTPYLGTSWPYFADRNVLGRPLRAGNRLHLKGLGLHSAAQLTYTLDQAYRRFETELALDDQTEGRGSVTLQVQVDDGAGGWRVKYESPVVRGGTPPLPVSVDITGAKKIQLFVDFADRGDELDHADLLGAHLVK